MAAHLSQDAVLHFLQSGGGSVRNADLLQHFSGFIREHAERERNRELFKKFVNSVATVKQSDGVSYVVLRKKFRGHGPGGLHNAPPDRPVGADTRWNKVQRSEAEGPAPAGQALTKTILPAAGILAKSEALQVSSTASPPGRPAAAQVGGPVPERRRSGLNGSTPVLPAEPQQVPQTLKENLQELPLPIPAQVSPRRAKHRQSYKTAVSQDEAEDEEEPEILTNQQGLAKQAWPPNSAVTDPSRAMSASLPRIIEPPVHSSMLSSFSSSERMIPKICIQDTERETPVLGSLGWGSKPRTGQEPESNGPSLPAAMLSHGSQQPEPREGPQLSPSHSSVFSPSPDQGFSSSEWPLQRPPGASGRSSSVEDVQAKAGESVSLADSVGWMQQVEERHGANTNRTATLFDKQQPEACSTDNLHGNQGFRARVMPWHLSTGDLYHDHDEAESSEGSTSSPQLQPRSSVAKRLSSRLRNRMCRSLGADLDQLVQDQSTGGAEEFGRGGGSEAARLIRLHRISSSLSLRYNLSSSSLSSCSTPPRCQSLADLTEREGKQSLSATTLCNNDFEGRGRQSLVPLEPREHAWLVKGAAGAWPDIYSLFREDSSLLNRQDFISGFTVLHWIAKHGDHRVLNTLWYGVEKAGLSFDVDAKSNSGQTPLHVAAIHGNKNLMRLLVTKFKANVRLRDTAGKRPWQYLSRTAPLDMFQLLGAPVQAAVTGEGAGRVDSSWEVQQRRRRRHHLSSASSAERPLKLAGGTKVKRSSSIAAFLKHKSLHRFYGHLSDSPL